LLNTIEAVFFFCTIIHTLKWLELDY